MKVRHLQPPALEDKGKTLPAPARPPRPYDNKVTSLGSKEPRKAWEDDSHISDEWVAFLYFPFSLLKFGCLLLRE